MEIFGIKIYILPFAEDFSSFEKINDAFSNPFKNMNSSGVNFSRIDDSVLEYDSDNDNKENIIKMIGLSFNIYRIMSGMVGLAYGQ